MEPMRVKLTANAEVVTAAETAVIAALRATAGNYSVDDELSRTRELIIRLRESGFDIRRI